MNPTLHAQILTLRKYQAWRTGEDTRTMDEAGIVPAAVTSALDAVLEIAENHLRDTKQAEPSGYAYRYRDHSGGAFLRFNNGGEVNGSRPIEAVPYWFAPPNATTVTCQLYGHPLKTCAECNHELACPAVPASVPGDESAIRHHVDQKSGGKSSEKDLRNIIANARALLASSENSTAAPNISYEHCVTDATRYRTLRAMPPGIRVQVHVGEGEWEDVCSGDELDKTLSNARTI